jgi:hypothetical protein
MSMAANQISQPCSDITSIWNPIVEEEVRKLQLPV